MMTLLEHNPLHNQGNKCFAGQVQRLHPDGAYAPADNSAQIDDTASAATERMTEDEYADSATHSHGPHDMVPKTEQMHKTHDHFAAQDRYEDDHTETSSEGTR